MIETNAHWQYEAVPEPANDADTSGGTFVAAAAALQDQSEKLIQLAEACKTQVRQLAEREQELALTSAALDQRRQEVESRQRELDEMAARAHQAQIRINEADERETALRALAEQILARYAAR